MIEWKQGEPPRDGKWYLVLHAGEVMDIMACITYDDGESEWWNSINSFVDDDDFSPDYWAEINLPDGYHIHGILEEAE